MATPRHMPARLTVRRGAARTSISTSSDIDGLAEMQFAGRQPTVAVGDEVLISYPVVGLPALRPRSATMVLREDRAWSVEIDGGAGYLHARLGAIAGPYDTRTAGLDDRDDHYRIAVGGGASRLSVTSRRARQRVSGAT